MLHLICFLLLGKVSPFLVLFKGRLVTFAENRPGYHDTYYPLKKGLTDRALIGPDGRLSEYTPNFSSIIGLIASSIGVEALPQENVYRPRLAFYDTTNENHVFAIHIIFKFISMNSQLPTRDHHLVHIQPNTGSACVAGGPIFQEDLNIMLQQDGRLVRGAH